MQLWMIGLALALVAPFFARIVANAFDAHARKRTATAIARERD